MHGPRYQCHEPWLQDTSRSGKIDGRRRPRDSAVAETLGVGHERRSPPKCSFRALSVDSKLELLRVRAGDDGTGPELMARPRPEVADAQRPPGAVRRRTIVNLPLQATALAGAISGGHRPAISADPDERESGSH